MTKSLYWPRSRVQSTTLTFNGEMSLWRCRPFSLAKSKSESGQTLLRETWWARYATKVGNLPQRLLRQNMWTYCGLIATVMYGLRQCMYLYLYLYTKPKVWDKGAGSINRGSVPSLGNPGMLCERVHGNWRPEPFFKLLVASFAGEMELCKNEV